MHCIFSPGGRRADQRCVFMILKMTSLDLKCLIMELIHRDLIAGKAQANNLPALAQLRPKVCRLQRFLGTVNWTGQLLTGLVVVSVRRLILNKRNMYMQLGRRE